jgi:hypothetical protein
LVFLEWISYCFQGFWVTFNVAARRLKFQSA